MVVIRENYQMHLGSERVYLAIADHGTEEGKPANYLILSHG